jgi:hypothetical protein
MVLEVDLAQPQVARSAKTLLWYETLRTASVNAGGTLAAWLLDDCFNVAEGRRAETVVHGFSTVSL